MKCTLAPLLIALLLFSSFLSSHAADNKGFYRYPALHGTSLVFTAQGDLYSVGIEGGNAHALTSHPGEETHAVFSPDGRWVAFTAAYEGPEEAYVMPINGGLPRRLSFDSMNTVTVGWTPEGKVLCSTYAYATLPDAELVQIDIHTLNRSLVPLRQASEGVYDTHGSLYFTRLNAQGSATRRYKGGTAQNLWKYATGMKEAVPLTASYSGTSRWPMWWKERVFFVSDRDGAMNLWSMNSRGGDLKQLTHHQLWDIQTPSLDQGRIVYQLGADLFLYDIASGRDRRIEITLASDQDQTREKWIKRPMDYLTSSFLSPDGSHIALTSRGRVFLTPVKSGRFVEATRKQGVRYRDARFAPDGKSLIALSDESGETEWQRLPVNGIGPAQPLSHGSSVLQQGGTPSPDGKWIVFTDKNADLQLFEIATGKTKKLASQWGYYDFRWSSDSEWIAYVATTRTFSRIWLYSLKKDHAVPVTSERYDSYNPAWSADGKWLYFLSDRHFQSLVPDPWPPRQAEPFFDRQTKIYQIGLTKGLRSPFQPDDELQSPPPKSGSDPAKSVATQIDMNGIQQRLWEVPVPAGNYGSLSVNGARLFWISRETPLPNRSDLMALEIQNHEIAAKTLVSDLRDYQICEDGKHLMVRKGGDLFVFEASGSGIGPSDRVDLGDWTFSVDPRQEWRQIVVDAWRLHRDYFYDRKMHGLDWPAVLKQYLPLVERVQDRNELNNLLAQMVSELSVLHTFVNGGDARRGTDEIAPAGLGARLTRDPAHGGYRVERIYHGDADEPESLSPLERPETAVAEGDVIVAINGVETLSVDDPMLLLRHLAGKQALLQVREAGTNLTRNCIVTPISPGQQYDLKYTDWELSRRKKVEEASKNTIGYLHLRAMGSQDIARWERDFYPLVDRQGLIIDVRHNGGGNIDSWILEKLLRRAWSYWQPRVGESSWNMPWAFPGHVVVLCDEWTASDGEAFAEGFRRLGIGKVIGTRTWGGEVWLSFDNTLVDNGIASAAETGVYGPEGKWLIEGHGVDPDIVVDNLPHASFLGEDAQLDAAIVSLQREIKAHPVPLPPPPAYPNKAFPRHGKGM